MIDQFGPTIQDYIDRAVADGRIFARGQTMQWTTNCPRCHQFSLTLWATKGEPYRGMCSSHACLRFTHTDALTSADVKIGVPSRRIHYRKRKQPTKPTQQGGFNL